MLSNFLTNTNKFDTDSCPTYSYAGTATDSIPRVAGVCVFMSNIYNESEWCDACAL